jgi:threonyl-tRNA synthetase
VLPISEKSNDYGAKVLEKLTSVQLAGGGGLRATLDDSNDRIQGKVKVAADEKVPYMLVVGPRDAETNSVSVRVRGVQKDLGAMPLERFVEALKTEIEERRAVPSVGLSA